MSIAEAARYSAAGARLRHRQIDHILVQLLDAQRIAPEQARRQRIVDMRRDGRGAVEGLAEADDPGVGVDADPQDVLELAGEERFYGDDFHGWLGGSRFVWEGCGLN